MATSHRRFGDHLEEGGACVGNPVLLEHIHRVRHQDHGVQQVHQPQCLRRQVVDVEPVEVRDRPLGVRCDGVVELDQVVERAVQPRRVPLGSGCQRPVVYQWFEFGEALGQLVFRHDFCSSSDSKAATVSRITVWNWRMSSSWSLRWNVVWARVFNAEWVASMVLTSCIANSIVLSTTTSCANRSCALAGGTKYRSIS